MNKIENIRAEINQYFDPKNIIDDSSETFFSPNARYKVAVESFRQNKPSCNWEVTKVEIFDNANAELLFSFFVNESTFFHSWVTKNSTEYLLCAEDLCGGQTVIDLTNKKVASHTENDDGFIGTKHILSPNEKFLAVFGCGWGSQFFVIIYYFDQPMDLPLKIACEPDWSGYDLVEWIDDKTLKVKTNEKEDNLLEIQIPV